MSDIDVLLFDLVGVLVQDSDVITEAVLDATEMTSDELWDFWVESEAAREFDAGRISSQEFAERMVLDLRLSIKTDEFIALFGDWIVGLYDGTEDLISRIPSRYKKACLSNINKIQWPPIRDKHGLDGLLDAYYLSYKIGMIKPDGDAFEFVVDDLGVSPERIAFFDDLEVNVNAARQAGLSAYQTRGLAELEVELKRLGVDQKSYEGIATLFKFDKVDDLLAAIGYGDINVQQITTRLIEAEREEEEPELPEAAPPPPEVTGVTVRGVGDLLTRVAGCCHPLPGDPVVGYVTRGRGITIHRQDCRNILYLDDQERLIEVDWGQDIQQVFPVMIQVLAYDRTGLMRDVTEITAEERINITSASAATDPKDHIAVITATLEISSILQLSRVLAKIERLPNVFEARRRAS